MTPELYSALLLPPENREDAICAALCAIYCDPSIAGEFELSEWADTHYSKTDAIDVLQIAWDYEIFSPHAPYIYKSLKHAKKTVEMRWREALK